jgi:hypothetical protein
LRFAPQLWTRAMMAGNGRKSPRGPPLPCSLQPQPSPPTVTSAGNHPPDTGPPTAFPSETTPEPAASASFPSLCMGESTQPSHGCTAVASELLGNRPCHTLFGPCLGAHAIGGIDPPPPARTRPLLFPKSPTRSGDFGPPFEADEAHLVRRSPVRRPAPRSGCLTQFLMVWTVGSNSSASSSRVRPACQGAAIVTHPRAAIVTHPQAC